MLHRIVAAPCEVGLSLRQARSSVRQSMATWRPRLLAAVCAAATTIWVPAVWAGVESGVVLAQQGGAVRTEAAGRNYTFEGIVVVIMLGLALFSVCRSSRRV